MAFWGKHDWLSNAQGASVVQNFSSDKVDEAGYRLSIGNEVYLPSTDGSIVKTLEKGESFFIAAGQFAFILTEETINIPLNTIGFISVRAGIKFHGLVNVSGFHVDPGYEGKLVFAVFNSGPSRINLKRGQDIFSLWLSQLLTANCEADRPKKGYSHLPPDLLNKIDGNHLTAYQISDKIDELGKIAKDNQDDLRRIKLYFWLAVIIIGLLVFPIARWHIKNFIESSSEYFSENTSLPSSELEDKKIPNEKN